MGSPSLHGDAFIKPGLILAWSRWKLEGVAASRVSVRPSFTNDRMCDHDGVKRAGTWGAATDHALDSIDGGMAPSVVPPVKLPALPGFQFNPPCAAQFPLGITLKPPRGSA